MSVFDRIKTLPGVRGIYRFPWLLGAYHYLLSFLGALWYGFPSRRITLIGVTGTKGKTTTSYLLYQLLRKSGRKTGLATTVMFAIGNREWINETKQTMLGRFALQKLLRQMVREGCTHAVVETSSWGVVQHRHRFIRYEAALFTNLTPEHIEQHGSFERYRSAKVALFAHVARRGGGVGIYNLDDPSLGHFLRPSMRKMYGVTSAKKGNISGMEMFRIAGLLSTAQGSTFTLNGVPFTTTLLGAFNAHNVALAAVAAASQGVTLGDCSAIAPRLRAAPGRMETIDEGQDFSVIVDYSYEVAGLTAALTAVRLLKPPRVISVIGGTGGGRDRWRRPVMGEIAAKNAEVVVVTTDDPYDEDPDAIAREIVEGVLRIPGKKVGENVFVIADRREAIRTALDAAHARDAVLISGKGGETWMNLAGGKRIPWEDGKVARELLVEQSSRRA